MDLLSYIADMGRRRELAAAVNASPDYLWQVATDRRKASTGLATAIEAATGCVVTRASIRPDVWGAVAPQRHRKKAA